MSMYGHGTEWRNVPRSDGYSPAQLMFARAQCTSLPTLPSQYVPIDFNTAASSKDAVQARAKLDHERLKLSYTSSSPGQEVYLQDSKSSAWNKRGVIISMQPDRLSCVIRVDNWFFTRPQWIHAASHRNSWLCIALWAFCHVIM